MRLPDGTPLEVDQGVLAEPAGVEDRFILWLPGERSGNDQYWDRVALAAGASFTERDGVRAIAATSVRARQRLGIRLGGILRRLVGSGSARTWRIPNGRTVEQCAERRTDLELAWLGRDSGPRDEVRIAALWPESHETRAIGKGLFLVMGVASAPKPAAVKPEAEPAPSAVSPRQLGERALAVARSKGDLREIVTALADLGLACLQENDPQRAVTLLDEAMAGARQLGDEVREADVMNSLGFATLSLGQPKRARDLLALTLAYVHSVGDRQAEKLVLNRMGLAHIGLGEHAVALECFERALALATDLGDRPLEAELLWNIGVQHAELGRRDQAVAYAEAAIRLLKQLGKPHAEWHTHLLARYKTAETAAFLAKPGDRGPSGGFSPFATSIDTTRFSSPGTAASATGPGLLRMALSAKDAMMKFIGSGFKTTTPEEYRARLAVCSTCEHHTGIRCRICGCFTAAKAKLVHEQCPAGRWPT